MFCWQSGKKKPSMSSSVRVLEGYVDVHRVPPRSVRGKLLAGDDQIHTFHVVFFRVLVGSEQPGCWIASTHELPSLDSPLLRYTLRVYPATVNSTVWRVQRVLNVSGPSAGSVSREDALRCLPDNERAALREDALPTLITHDTPVRHPRLKTILRDALPRHRPAEFFRWLVAFHADTLHRHPELLDYLSNDAGDDCVRWLLHRECHLYGDARPWKQFERRLLASDSAFFSPLLMPLPNAAAIDHVLTNFPENRRSPMSNAMQTLRGTLHYMLHDHGNTRDTLRQQPLPAIDDDALEQLLPRRCLVADWSLARALKRVHTMLERARVLPDCLVASTESVANYARARWPHLPCHTYDAALETPLAAGSFLVVLDCDRIGYKAASRASDSHWWWSVAITRNACSVLWLVHCDLPRPFVLPHCTQHFGGPSLSSALRDAPTMRRLEPPRDGSLPQKLRCQTQMTVCTVKTLSQLAHQLFSKFDMFKQNRRNRNTASTVLATDQQLAAHVQQALTPALQNDRFGAGDRVQQFPQRLYRTVAEATLTTTTTSQWPLTGEEKRKERLVLSALPADQTVSVGLTVDDDDDDTRKTTLQYHSNTGRFQNGALAHAHVECYANYSGAPVRRIALLTSDRDSSELVSDALHFSASMLDDDDSGTLFVLRVSSAMFSTL